MDLGDGSRGYGSTGYGSRGNRGVRLTVANYTNIFVLEIIAPVPTSRMHNLALELLKALDLGVARLVQLANGRDEKVCLDGIAGVEFGVLAASDLDIDFPF
jgi:hypothetical protein